MRGSVKALIRFIQEKSVVDVVYLVMMILIVTMIKDMIMSMYRKRKDTNWLRGVFNNKQKKVEEKFTTLGPTMGCPDPADTITQRSSVCEKLKFLLCDNNFEKVRRLLGGVTIGSDVTRNYVFDFNTYGGNIDTTSPGNGYSDGTVSTGTGNITTYGGGVFTYGGRIDTSGGNIDTSGGNIDTSGGIGTGTIICTIVQCNTIQSKTANNIINIQGPSTADNVHIKLYGKLEVMDGYYNNNANRNITTYTIKTTDIGHLGDLNIYGNEGVYIAKFAADRCDKYGQLVSKGDTGDKYFALGNTDCSN